MGKFYQSFPDKPPIFHDGVLKFYDGKDFVAVNKFDSLADLPAASDFTGVAQVGGMQLVSDGQHWIKKTRETPLRVAYFGDSTASLVANAGNFNIETFDIAFPGSGATDVPFGVGVSALTHLVKGLHLVANCGIGGENTTQMLARDNAASGVTRAAINDLLNIDIDVVIFSGGSINNLGSITSGNYASTVATCLSEHITLLNRLLATGAVIIDDGILGGSSSSWTNPTLVRQAIVELNAAFKVFANQHPTRIYFIDWVGILSNADGSYISKGPSGTLNNYSEYITYDGVHLLAKGSYLRDKKHAEILNSVFGNYYEPRHKGLNLVTNPTFSAITAQSYGDVADGLGIFSTNADRANAKVEVINGKIYQTCEFTNTAASGNGNIRVTFNASTMGIVSGDIYGFEFDWMISGVDGSSIPELLDNSSSAMHARVEFTKLTGGGKIFYSNYSLFVDRDSAITEGHYYSQPIKINEASAELTSASTFRLSFSARDNGAQYKLGIANPRIVKLS